MGYVVSSLPAYVNQNSLPLLQKSIFGAKTQTIVSIMPGVKGQKALNILDNTATFQTDACGFNSVDSTTLTQRVLTVGHIKVDQNFCPITLEGKYAETQLKAGQFQDTMPFEQSWSELQANQIAAQLETAIWTGDLSSGSANLNKFDGFLKIIASCGSAISGSTSGITQSNIIQVLNNVYNTIPVQVLAKDDMRILVGFDTYRTFTQALTAANLYNYAVNTATDYESILPGTNIKIVALNGLNGTNKIVAARLSNLVLGVDLEEDSADLKLWFSQDFQEIRSTVKFSAGVQVGFCQEIVLFF